MGVNMWGKIADRSSDKSPLDYYLKEYKELKEKINMKKRR